MESRGHPRQTRVRSPATRRACGGVCAFLLCLTSAAHAGPRWEYEAGIQTAQTVLEKSYPPLGTPVPGFVAFGAPVWEGGGGADAPVVCGMGEQNREGRARG